MTGMFEAGGARDAGAALTPAQRELLADYVGGALAGTPAEAEVAQWVAADPAWRQAHDAIVAASAAVRAELRAWARAPEPMPEDVAARLAAALRAEGIGPAPAERVAPVVPIGLATGRRRQRAPRWFNRAAVAAGVLAVAGLSVSAVQTMDGSGNTGRPTAQGTLSSPTAVDGELRATSEVPLAVSGTAYTPGSLAQAGSLAGARSGRLSGVDAGRVPPGLARLAAPAARTACLAALRATQPRTARVTLVDYAVVAGQPALVVVTEERDGTRAVTAVGAECGQPAGEAAVLHRVAAP